MKKHSIQEIKEIFLKNRNEIAFLIGNGINRYNDKDGERSWENLIKNLSERYTDLSFDNPSGISLTEFYDIIEIKSKKDKENIQENIIKILNNWKFSDNHRRIVEKIRELDVPILTTNFDYLLAKCIESDFKKYSNIQGKFSQFYPWKYYFSTAKIDNPTAGFAIWHINGMQEYHKSIRLGLTDYMGMVRKAHSLIHKSENNLFDGKNTFMWEGYQTWLHIIFNKSLFIFGLGLDEQEVFLRWLLTERAKYFKKFPERKKNGWYVYINKKFDAENEGKSIFLKALDIDVLFVDSYKEFYEDLWKLDFLSNNNIISDSIRQ
jgi:hypothetical protein